MKGEVYIYPAYVLYFLDIAVGLLVADYRELIIVLLRYINGPGKQNGIELNPGLLPFLEDTELTVLLNKVFRGQVHTVSISQSTTTGEYEQVCHFLYPIDKIMVDDGLQLGKGYRGYLLCSLADFEALERIDA